MTGSTFILQVYIRQMRIFFKLTVFRQTGANHQKNHSNVLAASLRNPPDRKMLRTYFLAFSALNAFAILHPPAPFALLLIKRS